MIKLSKEQQEIARNIKKSIREGFAVKGNESAMKHFGFSASYLSKFLNANNPDECKINLDSLSEWLAYSGVTMTPKGSVSVPVDEVLTAYTLVHNSHRGSAVQIGWEQKLKESGLIITDEDGNLFTAMRG